MRRKSNSPDNVRNSPTPDSELGSHDHRNTLTPRPSPRSRPNSGFNTVRAVRNASTPINEMTRADRRFWPKDTRVLLEMCEQGYQLQKGMKSHCQETACALENLTDSCENCLKSMFDQMEETLKTFQKEFEKPVNVDWTPMTDQFRNLHSEVVKSMASEHQETVDRLAGQLTGRIAERLDELSSTTQHLEDLQQGQLQEMREELRQVHVEMKESVKNSQAQFESFLVEQSRAWKTAETRSVQMQGVQEVMAKRVGNMEPLVAGVVLANEVNARGEELVKEIHDTVHTDLLQLFHEVGKIQRELNIDFVAPPNKTKNYSNLTRLREMWAQTDNPKLHDSGCQVDPSLLGPVKKGKKKRRHSSAAVATLAVPKALQSDPSFQKKKNLFADEEQMKAKMRAQLIRPEYNVANYYHTTGCAQAIARNPIFEHLTFLIIVVNALWLAVDTDLNNAVVLVDASPVFQVSENVFCTYFFVELVIRFAAFREKRFCCRDFWFVFDGLLVAGMVLETWVLTIILLSFNSRDLDRNVGHFSVLRIARLVKLFRMARMARLLRMVPELLVIVRGIGAAIRSVGFFILLTLIIVYVFAIFFRQVTRDTTLEKQYFSSVPDAMNSLVFDAMLPLYSQVVDDLMHVNAALYPAIVAFILLASVTVLNMLIGVLVEVVRTVAATEKEGMTVTHVTHQLKAVMDTFHNGPVQQGYVSERKSRLTFLSLRNVVPIKSDTEDVKPGNLMRGEFENFLMQPEVGKIIHDVGVDVVGLLDMADMIYEDKDKDGKGLTFADFIDVVLNMRGTNPSTVKDVKQQIRIMKNAMKDSAEHLHKQMVKDLAKVHDEVMQHIIEIRKAQIRADRDSEDGDSQYESTLDLQSRTISNLLSESRGVSGLLTIHKPTYEESSERPSASDMNDEDESELPDGSRQPSEQGSDLLSDHPTSLG